MSEKIGEWSDWVRKGDLCDELDVAPASVHYAIKRGRGATIGGGFEVERRPDPARARWFLYRYRYAGREERGLQKLSPEDVEAIFEAYQDGETQAEIARALGVTASAVSYHLRKVRAK